MSISLPSVWLLIFIVASLPVTLTAASEQTVASEKTAGQSPVTASTEEGEVSFVSKTNFSAITVKGKSKALVANASVRHEGSGLAIENLRAHVEVETLETGMGLRDEHMRAKIFAVGDRLPAVRFTAAKTVCPGQPGSGEFRCAVEGLLTIRDRARPARFDVTLRSEAGGARFRVSGSGNVKLSDFGVERPSQLGVTVEDIVELQMRFVAGVSGASTGLSQ